MIEVKGPADLAVGDQVEVREYNSMGTSKGKRGVVTTVGKVAASVDFRGGATALVRYMKVVTDRDTWRGPRKSKHFPIRKLTPRDIWLEQCPRSERVCNVGSPGVRVIEVDAEELRDNLALVLEDLRAYSEWLNDEPKEGA